jgi:hypothetical protein
VSITAAERAVLIVTYVVLVAIGVLLATIETFLVPLRLAGGVEGLSAVLALLGNAVVGSIGGAGTRTTLGAILPGFGWFVAVAFFTFYVPGGGVVIPGALPVDPGIVAVGLALLILGIFGIGLALLVTSRYTARVIAPTPTA